jgi:propanediol dehydratase-reactivating factor small subunit
VSAHVLALLAAGAPSRELAARFEEEGVPLLAERSTGDAGELARQAARRSPLGAGLGADATRLVLVLAGDPRSRPYLEAPAGDAARFARAAARVVARRPLP